MDRHVCKRVRKIMKSDYQLRHVRMSIRTSLCPHGKTQLPLEGFSRSLIYWGFFGKKKCRENSSFIKIWYE